MPGTLYEFNTGNTAGGSAIVVAVQRTDLDLGDKADIHQVVHLRLIATGGAFDVRVGTQEITGGTVTWSDAKTWTPGTTRKLDFRAIGRLHALQFESAADVAWSVSDVEIDYEMVGRR